MYFHYITNVSLAKGCLFRPSLLIYRGGLKVKKKLAVTIRIMLFSLIIALIVLNNMGENQNLVFMILLIIVFVLLIIQLFLERQLKNRVNR